MMADCEVERQMEMHKIRKEGIERKTRNGKEGREPFVGSTCKNFRSVHSYKYERRETQ